MALCAVAVVILLVSGVCSLPASTIEDSINATSVFSSAFSPGTQDSLLSCREVREIFALRQIGPVQLVPEAPVKGEENELCPAAMSCCTSKMEDRYKEVVKKDLKAMLQTASSYLKTLIATSATKFRENFLEMIQVSENKTLVLFSEVYKKMDTVARAPVTQLYADLASHLSGRDVDIEEKVAYFFDTLFPVVYHHSINPKLKDFSSDYKECLTETREEIRPFGELPQKITTHLTRSFGTARTFLQALSLGVEVINTTENMDFGPECSKALVKLTYCPHCLTMVAIKPCGAYCLNVVRGCLSAVAELDSPWSEFLSAIERLASGFVGTYNIEEVVSTLDTKISEAIMHAMENGPELSRKVKVACGNPKRATRDVSESADHLGATSEATSVLKQSAASGTLSASAEAPGLLVRLQNFAKKLSESKNFYGNLADTLCNEDSLTTGSGEQCWNGKTVGEYSKTVVGVGVTAQKYNPELKVIRSIYTTPIATIVDKLTHLKQILNSRATSVPQSDSYLVEGSGSGSYWHNRVGDDEDYGDEGSGSGDGVKVYKNKGNDFTFTTGEEDVKDNSSVGSLQSSLFVLMVSAVLTTCLRPATDHLLRH